LEIHSLPSRVEVWEDDAGQVFGEHRTNDGGRIIQSNPEVLLIPLPFLPNSRVSRPLMDYQQWHQHLSAIAIVVMQVMLFSFQDTAYSTL
jgi:hypothetical protein